MQLHWLNDNLAVSGQLSAKNIDELSSMKIKSIICNRPDFETDDAQPTAESVSIECKRNEIEFFFHPVQSNFQTELDAEKMAELLKSLPKPIVAYCRTGGRSMSLIGMTNQLGLIDLKDV